MKDGLTLFLGRWEGRSREFFWVMRVYESLCIYRGEELQEAILSGSEYKKRQFFAVYILMTPVQKT